MQNARLLHEGVLKSTATKEFLTDAIACAPGGGDVVVSDGRIYEVDWSDRTNRIWVGGTRNDPPYTLARIEELLSRNGKIPSRLAFQGYAAHTQDQTSWIAQQLLIHPEISTLLLTTARYHLPRFALTFVKSWLTAGDGRDLHLAVLPTSDPKVAVDSPTSQTYEEEIERIEKYQKLGYVATFDEAAPFFRWQQKPQS